MSMRQLFLLVPFTVLLMSEMFGWKLGISEGLSIKNGFLYAFLMVILIEHAVGGSARDPLLLKVHIPFVTLIILAGLSWAFTDIRTNIPHYSSEDRLMAVKNLLADFYLFFLVYYYGARNLEEAMGLAKMMLALTVLSNIVTIIDVYDIPDLGIVRQMEGESEHNRGRLMGPIGEPNQYAAFLAFFIPSYVALAMASARKNVASCMYLAASLATLVALLLTGSRGGVLGLVAGAAWGYWLVRHLIRLRTTIKGVALMVPVIGVAIAFAAMKYGALLLARVEVTASADTATDASAGRTWIWETALSLMGDHPLSYLIGMGWHTFAPYVGVVPHNTYLWYFFNLGAIGLMLYLIIVRNLLKVSRQAINGLSTDGDMLLKGFVFGFTALLTSVLFVDLFSPWYFIWAYIGTITRVAVEMNAEAQQQCAPSLSAEEVNDLTSVPMSGHERQAPLL